MKKKLLQYGITAVICALIALWVMDAEGLFVIWGKDSKGIFAILCDAFFVAGIIPLLFGILMWIATTGFFDGIGFGLRFVVKSLIPTFGKNYKTYYDYKTEKEANRKPNTTSFLLIVGLFFLVVSGAMLLLYYYV